MSQLLVACDWDLQELENLLLRVSQLRGKDDAFLARLDLVTFLGQEFPHFAGDLCDHIRLGKRFDWRRAAEYVVNIAAIRLIRASRNTTTATPATVMTARTSKFAVSRSRTEAPLSRLRSAARRDQT